MRVGLLNDWITTYAGSEKVLEAIACAFPEAPLHTLIFNPKVLEGTRLGEVEIKPSFMDRLPFAKRLYKAYLPLMPFGIEQVDMDAYDVVISSSHAVAKGLITHTDQLHICYMHTPIRYAWDLQHTYLKESGLGFGPKGLLARAMLHYIRSWDQASANRPDVYVANSEYIARRIKKIYKRDAEVIYPPVDVDRFKVSHDRDDYYLTVTRLVPYKKVDLLAKACIKSNRRLVVIGDGPEMKKLQAISHPNIELLGKQDDAVVTEHMEKCRALMFAADEDFGIVPVEAQAAGTPVIALGKGGTLETVVDRRTGVHFYAQQVDAICDAIARFERIENDFDHDEIAAHAEQFSRSRFDSQIKQCVVRHWDQMKSSKQCQLVMN